MRQVELQGRDRDVTFGEGADVGVWRHLGGGELRLAPEIDTPPRIDPAVKRFQVGSDILRDNPDATHRPLVEAGDIDVEETAGPWTPRDNLLDHFPGQLGGAREIERLGLGIFERYGD